MGDAAPRGFDVLPNKSNIRPLKADFVLSDFIPFIFDNWGSPSNLHLWPFIILNRETANR